MTAHKGSEARLSRRPLAAELPDPDADPFAFPYNCGFRRESFLEDPEPDSDYDVILCLSVTKWIHFNHGDEGIKRLFTKFYAALKPGGRLILEAQDWGSYRKKKSLCESFKRHVAAIQLRPDMFDKYLLEEVGFASSADLIAPPPASAVGTHGNSGFHRPMRVYLKASG